MQPSASVSTERAQDVHKVNVNDKGIKTQGGKEKEMGQDSSSAYEWFTRHLKTVSKSKYTHPDLPAKQASKMRKKYKC